MTDDDWRRLVYRVLTDDVVMLQDMLAIWEPRIDESAEVRKLVEDARAALAQRETWIAEHYADAPIDPAGVH